MREVVENSPRVVGYSCSEGIKGEIQNDNFKRELFDVAYPHGKLHLGRRTHVMGILNVTPDSFYDGKRYNTTEIAVNHASKMIEEGADIIDVGGESTRPGAYPIPEAEELKRVIPLIKILSKQTRKPISVDTYKAKVAEKAIDAGASIINDIGGLLMDKHMAKVAAKAKVPVIIMHKKGNPRTMQKHPVRGNVLSEIKSALRKSVIHAINAGIDESKIILDPGIGFGKTLHQNLIILKRLREFKSMGFPTHWHVTEKVYWRYLEPFNRGAFVRNPCNPGCCSHKWRTLYGFTMCVKLSRL